MINKLNEASNENFEHLDSSPTGIKELNFSAKYNAVNLMLLWYNDAMKEHTEYYHTGSDSPCESGEVLMAKALNIKTLSPIEEYELYSAYLSEQDEKKKAALRNEFLTRNLRLVMHLAKQQAQRCDYTPIELMSWGFMGMARAFDKFKLDRGVKFSTYAARWIQQAMTRGLAETQRSIRIPYNIITDQGKMKRFCQEFLNKTGTEPEDIDIMSHFKWNEKKLEYVRKGLQPISSIDVPATDGEDTIANLIEDNGMNVEDDACNKIKHEAIMEILLDTLDDRARDIIMNLFYYKGRNILNKDELAKKYNVTRERILQIRDESISLLRHPSKSRKLRGFLIS